MAFSLWGSTPIAVTKENFSPSARCDLTGMICLHKDLVPVLQWSGDTLVNTGLLAHKNHVDIPNPVGKTPRKFMDPRPVNNPRPFQTGTKD
jgi:hypothetical protein